MIGIACGGRPTLAESHLSTILKADLLIASEKHLALFPEFAGDTLAITSNIKEVGGRCEDEGEARRVVVLGSGDPNFYGIGRYLLNRLGPGRVRVHPAPSSMQEAFARVGLPWHDAVFGSCHGKPLQPALELVRHNASVGLFTDPANSPRVIARALLDAGLPDLEAHVCCRLGEPDETLIHGPLSKIAETDAPEPNILIVRHNAPPARPLRLGMAEDAFAHRKPKVGLITKREIRAVAISNLGLNDASVVWDIGAGSGSVAVECALIAHRGQVFAVEKNEADIDNVRTNADTFGASHLTAVHCTAPDGLDQLPDPDAIFIGGSGGNMEALLNTCLSRLRPGGRLVMTLVTLENLAAAHSCLKGLGITPEVTQVQIARGEALLDMTRLAALNPVTILACTGPGKTAPGSPDPA